MLHVAALAWFLAPATGSSAQSSDGPLIDLEVSQRTGLTDGELVDVTVRARTGVRISTNPTHTQGVFICRPGVAYTTSSDVQPRGGNCPVHQAVSSSSHSSKPLFPLANGSEARTPIAVGVGAVEWQGEQTSRLTCDPDNPCLLVALVKASVDGGPFVDTTAAVELSYASSDPLVGCRPTPAGFTSAGSDRLQSWWTELSLGACEGTGDVPSNFAPLGEGEAVAAFASGARDVAYTASGDRPGVAGMDAPAERATVYTPVGINAAVIALVGGNPLYEDPTWPVGLPHPYTDIKLSATEVASMLAVQPFFFSERHSDAVHARNPELPPGPLYSVGSTVKIKGTIAVQGPTSVTYFTTTYVDSRAPGEWKGTDESGAPADRGVFASFASAVPKFAGILTEVSTKSQIAALRNVGLVQDATSPGPVWALTDYATAIELGLTPVSIENAAGEFVKPTPETLAAAVPTMTVDADGRRTPDVSTAAAGAYPLTMVEYAMAPAEALVDDACAPRTGSKALLTSWLQYVTGPGQQEMPDGLVPLTGDLQSEAQASIARVGASPSTATCAPPPTGPPATPPAAPAAVPTGGGLGGAGGTGLPSSRRPTSSSGTDAADAAITPSSPDELEGAAELADAARPTLPPFLGIRAVSEVISPVALLLIVALTASAAFATSGRPLPAPVARAPGRAVSAIGRAARWRPRLRRHG